MEAAETKNKYLAVIFTIGFHALLFLLFILIVFITPIPPFEIKPVPEIEIGLGMEGAGNTASGGSGQNDPNVETSMDAAVTAANVAPNVITDETGVETNVKPNPNPTPENTAETLSPEEKKEREQLEKALAKIKAMKDKKGNGDGGKNTGGTGNGNNTGVGDGPGTGIGDGTPGGPGGTGWDLKGRSLLKKPARMTDSEEEGKVVVEIIVDETGKVVKATAGARGSTTTSSKLYSKARSAAFEAKFSPSPEGIKEQRGTYTFVFTLE